MAQMPPALFLPNMLTFNNGNSFIGSFLGLRFRISVENTQTGERQFSVLCWYGENCLEESEIRDTAVFPLTPEGREQVIRWILVRQEEMPGGQTSAEKLPAGGGDPAGQPNYE